MIIVNYLYKLSDIIYLINFWLLILTNYFEEQSTNTCTQDLMFCCVILVQDDDHLIQQSYIRRGKLSLFFEKICISVTICIIIMS